MLRMRAPHRRRQHAPTYEQARRARRMIDGPSCCRGKTRTRPAFDDGSATAYGPTEYRTLRRTPVTRLTATPIAPRSKRRNHYLLARRNRQRVEQGGRRALRQRATRVLAVSIP